MVSEDRFSDLVIAVGTADNILLKFKIQKIDPSDISEPMTPVMLNKLYKGLDKLSLWRSLSGH